MKFLRRKEFILVLILVLAIFLRFYNIGNVPPSASLDEASIGYNAYSVLKTGGDEYGQFPLISQRGYDDFRRSTYLMLVVPPVGLFGLNAVSVRLPSIILSILTVWATFHIALLLFPKRTKFSETVAIFSSFMLAISPWHIYISRLGHESNACLSFLVFGVLFFILGIRSKNVLKLFISMVFFTLSMISYYSGQAFIPLFVLSLIFIYRKNLFSFVLFDKKIIIYFFIFIIAIAPIVWTIFSPASLIRFQGTSTFKPQAHAEEFAKRVQLWNKAVKDSDLIGIIIYNQHLFPVKVFMDGYLSHFKSEWIFANSGSDPFKAPNMGLLYLWEAPFIILGFFVLIFSREIDPKSKKLIFLWLIFAPIPAAIATQAPHAMRSYNFLPTWQIFTALGLTYLLFKFQKYKLFILSGIILLFILSISNFYRNYFILFPKEQSKPFQYALSKAIPYVESQRTKYKKIVFSNRDNLYQSYMFYLFYSKYDPKKYQKEGGTKSGGFAESHRFDNLVFMPVDSNKMKPEKDTLYVGNVYEFQNEIKPLKTFGYLNGEKAIEAGIVK